MLVVMRQDATPEQVRGCHGGHRGARVSAPPDPGSAAHGDRHHGQPRRRRPARLREPSRRARGHPGLPRLQARLARGEAREHRRVDRRRARWAARRSSSSPAPARSSRTSRRSTIAAAVKDGRRAPPARRRLQAPHEPLRVPGAGRGGAEDPRRGARGDGPARRHRGRWTRRALDLVERYADAIQIGARNMQNFSLLEAGGQARRSRCC